MPGSRTDNALLDTDQQGFDGLGGTAAGKQVPAPTLVDVSSQGPLEHGRAGDVMLGDPPVLDGGALQTLPEHAVHERETVPGPHRQPMQEQVVDHRGADAVVSRKAIAEQAVRIVTGSLPLRPIHLVSENRSDLQIALHAGVEELQHPA